MKRLIFVWGCIGSFSDLETEYNIDNVIDLRNHSVFDIDESFLWHIKKNKEAIFIIGSPYPLRLVNVCLRVGKFLKNKGVTLPEHLDKYEECSLKTDEVQAWEYTIDGKVNCHEPETGYIGETVFDRLTRQTYDEFNELDRLTHFLYR